MFQVGSDLSTLLQVLYYGLMGEKMLFGSHGVMDAILWVATGWEENRLAAILLAWYPLL